MTHQRVDTQVYPYGNDTISPTSPVPPIRGGEAESGNDKIGMFYGFAIPAQAGIQDVMRLVQMDSRLHENDKIPSEIATG